MARDTTIKVLRATRAALTAKASANELIQGEPYYITDEERMAVGAGTGGFRVFANEGDLAVPVRQVNSVSGGVVDLAAMKGRSGVVLFNSTSDATVNNFTTVAEGQELTLLNVNSGNITISRSNAYLQGSAAQVLAYRTSIRIVYISPYFYQISPLLTVN